MVLNGLAVIYSNKLNRMKEAEKAYVEVLNIYRNLAKTNRSNIQS